MTSLHNDTALFYKFKSSTNGGLMKRWGCSCRLAHGTRLSPRRSRRL